MFQFPRLPLSCLYIQQEVPRNDSWWVYPFGNPRVTGYVLLTVAYRSLSRPSSASCAKASTVCPYHLLFDGLNILFCTLIITYQMRSDAIFLKKIEFLFVTLCSSQGTRGRTLETEYCALSCNKDINGKDGNYSSKKLVLSLLKRVSP